MSTDLSLQIVVGATDAASSVVNNIAGSIVGSLSGVNPVLGAVAGGMLAIVGGAVMVGTTATKMAADYQQSMNMVQALTGSSDAQMAQYDTSLKNLAVTAGVAPTELAKGLYNVLSAGFSGAQAMQVLTLATEDAKIGMTDAKTTTNALTTVLKAFNVSAGDTNRVNGEMLETVTLGKMSMEQYAGAIGKASSTSMQYHVSMENMNASIATLTANGIPSAAQAVTDYNQTLSVMYGNIGTVSKSLQKNGIAFDEAKFNTMSYTDKIQYLNTALQEANDKHVHITGVTKQAAQAIQVISQHSAEYAKNLQALSDKQSMAQKTQQAWGITQSGFNQSMDRLKSSLDVLMINIGNKLLPILSGLMSQVAPLIGQFTTWLTSSGFLDKAVAGLTSTGQYLWGVLKDLYKDVQPLIAQFITWAQKNDLLGKIMALVKFNMQAFGAEMRFLVPVLVRIIAAVAQFIVEIVNRLMPTILALSAFWQAHWQVISATLQGAWTFISSIVKWAWDLISGIIKIGLDILTGNWSQAWTDLKDMFANLWNDIQGILQGALQMVWGLIQLLWAHISTQFSQAWQTSIVNPLQSLWQNIVNFFSGWPAVAAQWGVNLIVGFANGIMSAIGHVTGAVQNVMSTVAGFLGFHSPAKEGEGQHLLEWPRNMVKSYADEMAAQTPYLASKVSMLVAPLVMMSHAVPLTNPSSGGSGGNVTVGEIHVHLGDNSASAQQHGVAVATATKAELAKILRQQGSSPRLTSGGH